MNPMYNGDEHIQIRVYTSEQEKFGAEATVTSEMIDSMGMEQVGSQSLRLLLDILDRAYDEDFYWENGDIQATNNQRIWKKVKNINTDEELEEIKMLLGITDG